MKMSRQWQELMVLAGIAFNPNEIMLDLLNLKEDDQKFLEVIFNECGLQFSYNFITENAPTRIKWINALRKLQDGRTEMLYRFEDLQLAQLDTEITGVITQINLMGFPTFASCAGHRGQLPYLYFETDGIAKEVSEFFNLIGITNRQRNKQIRLQIKTAHLFDLALYLYDYRLGNINQPMTLADYRQQTLLEALLMIPGISGEEENVRQYLCEYLENRVDTFTVDHAGNIIVTKQYGEGSRPIILSAHMDVVQSDIQPQFTIIKNGSIWSRASGILGADDRAGIAAILTIMNHLEEIPTLNLTLKVIFTVHEEYGQLGAKELDTQIFEDVSCAISLDRRNSNDIVVGNGINEYCSKEFGQMLEIYSRQCFNGKYNYHCKTGGISDLTHWSQLGVESVNLSIGYYNEHTCDEYLNLTEWQLTIQFVVFVIRRLTTKKR